MSDGARIPKGPTPQLHVAIFGNIHLPDAKDWSAILASSGLAVVAVESLSALEEADLGMIFARPGEMPGILEAMGAGDHLPPVTILMGAAEESHPHTRLVKTLLQSKRDWERAFDAIVDPVALLDADGRIVRANLGFARVLGRPVAEVIGAPYSTLLGRMGETGSDPVAESLLDGKARTSETRYASLPGIQQVTTSPLGDEGARAGLVVIFKDVSERKDQQERLLQAARLADIGQLAGGVAHEINTPLASIALRAESLLKSAEDPNLQAIDSFRNFPRYLKSIDEEVFRCKRIIGALLEFSRSRKPEVRETDLNALAESATDLVGYQMKFKRVETSLDLARDLPHIRADDGQLRQALIALLINALDATAAGGHVRVETRRVSPDTVSIAVADDGMGIPAANLDKLFSPFFTTKPTGKGTGLGLAMCHGIVTSHGGEIRVESQENKGARFTLVLPIDAAPRSPAP